MKRRGGVKMFHLVYRRRFWLVVDHITASSYVIKRPSDVVRTRPLVDSDPQSTIAVFWLLHQWPILSTNDKTSISGGRLVMLLFLMCSCIHVSSVFRVLFVLCTSFFYIIRIIFFCKFFVLFCCSLFAVSTSVFFQCVLLFLNIWFRLLRTVCMMF